MEREDGGREDPLSDRKSAGGNRGNISVFSAKDRTMRLHIKLCVLQLQRSPAYLRINEFRLSFPHPASDGLFRRRHTSRALYAPHTSTALSNASTHRLQCCRGCIACAQHVGCQKLISRGRGVCALRQCALKKLIERCGPPRGGWVTVTVILLSMGATMELQ